MRVELIATLISKAESPRIGWTLQSLIRGEKLMHTALHHDRSSEYARSNDEMRLLCSAASR